MWAWSAGDTRPCAVCICAPRALPLGLAVAKLNQQRLESESH